MTGKVFIAAHVEQELFDKLEATAQALGMSKAALFALIEQQEKQGQCAADTAPAQP